MGATRAPGIDTYCLIDNESHSATSSSPNPRTVHYLLYYWTLRYTTYSLVLSKSYAYVTPSIAMGQLLQMTDAG